MKVQRSEDGNTGRFYIEDNDRQIALMTYQKSGENIITVDHTEVDANFRGTGLGEDLVAEGVRFARENDLKIIPQCPFARAEFDKHAAYADVLAD